MFPLVKPAVTPSKNNTTCTRSQNLQTPAAALLLYLSQTCSGFGLPACHCSLVQSGLSATVLGDNALTSWRDITVLERRYGRHYTSPALSTFTAHQTPFPQQNDFFCRGVKRDASAKGISVERFVLQGLSLTLSLNAPSALTF